MKSRSYLAAVLLVFLIAFFCLPNGVLGQPQSPGLAAPASSVVVEFAIPGPLRSFLRMAAVSQEASPEEVLPLLARSVVVHGYQQRQPTEFLILLNRYVQQARELRTLAGPEGVIHISNCDEAKPLLTILGYRISGPCGSHTVLETADADRAFITIDSGFPLAELEESLGGGKTFVDPFPSTNVPVLFTPNDWMAIDKNQRSASNDLVDSLIRDPNMARLYWAMARIDAETGNFLRQSVGLNKLVSDAAVLDFYGSHISIRGGRVVVPGGEPAEPAWKDLVGASPASPAEFVTRLISRDEGWLAAYFDALSRVSRNRQAYFTEPGRLRGSYEALRGKDPSPSPAKHSFRPDAGLYLLVNGLVFEPDGQPHIPGSLDVWKQVLRVKSDSKIVREWGRRAHGWDHPEQLITAMFALSRYSSSEETLNSFLALSEIDRVRSSNQRLDVQTARLLAEKFPQFGDQYLIFSEFPTLSNESITRFLGVAEGLNHISDHLLRSDALGLCQANVGLWQILARQGEIPDAQLNASWQGVVSPFASIRSSAQLFDAGMASLQSVLRAAAGRPVLSEDEIIALLAGPEQTSPEGKRVREEIADRIRVAQGDQRLVSLDTLFTLGDGLNQMAKGAALAATLVPLTGELQEFQIPRPLFTMRERSEYAGGIYGNRHITLQMRTNLKKVIESPGSPGALVAARGYLTPFLRDTLVGLNYAYYEPPGAQMIHNNPLFVRSHDFSGGEYSGEIGGSTEQIWRNPTLFGRGWTATGGVHLVGSMADLPYTLAVVEQDFIVPKNVQSLIWEDLVPTLVTGAVLSRWWRVTQNELHAVTLYQRAGEELLAAATRDEKLRLTVMNILSDGMLPKRSQEVETALRAGRLEDALSQTTPAETAYLTEQFRRQFPGNTSYWGAAGTELESLTARYPAEVSWERLSEDFGVPHPALERNYARELLDVKPSPSFMGYSSRLLAESWDSSNLYWARLADEMGYPPVMLNTLIPGLTRRMVENIFASHQEDWVAMLRAMRETGEEFRTGKIASLSKGPAAPGL